MTQAKRGTVVTTPYETVRLSVDTRTPFGEFRDRYESAVPPLDTLGIPVLPALT